MPRKKKDPTDALPASAAAKVADLLRQDILSRREGEFLGNEDTLLERFGISRPTFRQSVRMLELEQLLEVRRGPDGGYYARKPTMQTVGRIAASYLESRNTSANQLIEAGFASNVLMIRRAAQSRDEAARNELATVRQKLENTDVEAQSFAEFHADELLIRGAMAKLANNPALELIINMLYQAAMDEAGPGPQTFIHNNGRRTEWKNFHLRLTEAVLNHEADIAAAIAERFLETLFAWRAEDGAH